MGFQHSIHNQTLYERIVHYDVGLYAELRGTETNRKGRICNSAQGKMQKNRQECGHQNGESWPAVRSLTVVHDYV